MPTDNAPADPMEFRRQRRLAAILRINAARTIDLARYEEEGCFDRFSYFESLAETHGATAGQVAHVAALLGPEEDFDGLVCHLEDGFFA